MAVYHGRQGRVYLSTTGSGNASAQIGLTSWSIDRKTDRVETTSFGAGNKTYVQGLPDLQGNLAGFWDDTDEKLFTAAESADGCKMYLYMSANASTKYWYGPAWIDVSIETGVGDAVKVSGTFAANGTWGRM